MVKNSVLNDTFNKYKYTEYNENITTYSNAKYSREVPTEKMHFLRIKY